MKRRTLLAGAAALAAAPRVVSQARAQAGKTKLVMWHAMTAANNDEMNRIARDFNASQSAAELEMLYKGTYPDTMTAAIAAWRAGQAPHIVQIFEVGTGTMLNAGPAVKQVWQLVKETGAKIDPANYLPAVRGYYSLADGRMASMPLNSSTPVLWYNRDAFQASGLDPDKPPATWEEFETIVRTLRDKWASKSQDLMASTSSWITWVQLECYSTVHNLPYASRADGFEGWDAVLECNSPAHVKHLNRLLTLAKEGAFKYSGRDNAPDPIFRSGKTAIGFGSSADRGTIAREAQFKWAAAVLPYDPEIIKSPNNTIIGGASLWTMTAPHRTEAEYKAVASFLEFIGQPAQDAMYHQHTGYVPVTLAGYELSRQQGYYEKNPGADMAIKSLTRGKVTENSKGLRLGGLPEIRVIEYEEIEKALQGQQTAKEALDNAVKRGNVVLRNFQKSIKG